MLVGIGDYAGNGMSDILWQNVNGMITMCQMNGSTITFATNFATVTPGSG